MRASDTEYMELALALARSAAAQGEVPVGAIVVSDDGAVIAEASNAPIATHDPTAHAEIVALREAGRSMKNYRLPGTSLYVTLEPCPMCAGAVVHARVERVVFGAEDSRSGACGSVFDLVGASELNHQVEVTGGVLAEESTRLLQDFFSERR